MKTQLFVAAIAVSLVAGSPGAAAPQSKPGMALHGCQPLRHLIKAGRRGLEARGAALDLAGVQGGDRGQVAPDRISQLKTHRKQGAGQARSQPLSMAQTAKA